MPEKVRVFLCFLIYENLTLFDKIKASVDTIFAPVYVINSAKKYVIARKSKENRRHLRKTVPDAKNVKFSLPAANEKVANPRVGRVA